MQQPQIKIVQGLAIPKQRRKVRRPVHTFNLKAKPFEITPCMIAPVLPGETLTNLLYQARVVSDPIKNALIGWWQEYYFFYVPLLAMGDENYGNGNFTTDDAIGMILDPAFANQTAAIAAANSVSRYTFKNGSDWVVECLQLVMNRYFRDEDDLGSNNTIDQYPAAYWAEDNWSQSLKLETQGVDDNELPGVDDIEELDIIPGGAGLYAQWEMMRDHGTVNVTYEDFLRSYGVTVPAGEAADTGGLDTTLPGRYMPELIRFVRKWTYPVNHVEPTTGTPTSAVSWSIQERSDKKRFFKHPGFIFGVSVTRPKIYMGSQKGAAVGMLRNVLGFMPQVLQSYPYMSVQEEVDSATEGILQNQTTDYWLDLRDLYLRGDQFVNHAMSAAANHGLAIPELDLPARALTEAMVDSLFVTAGLEYIRQDGVVHLDILSRIGSDTTG